MRAALPVLLGVIAAGQPSHVPGWLLRPVRAFMKSGCGTLGGLLAVLPVGATAAAAAASVIAAAGIRLE
jgi:hypothetical protein